MTRASLTDVNAALQGTVHTLTETVTRLTEENQRLRGEVYALTTERAHPLREEANPYPESSQGRMPQNLKAELEAMTERLRGREPPSVDSLNESAGMV